MAGKSTISITFKLDGDSKGFKELSKDADGLKGVIQATVTESEQLKKSLINWSQGIQAVGAITDTIKNVSEAFGKMSEKMKSIQDENVLTSQLTGKTGEEMLKLRNNVKATADQFGEDFSETMIAVNSLSKGFGISIEEAMQLMRDGFVSGANANGEFIDTLKEYPRYFAEAGLSAEQFVAITTNAAKQGIYSDKGVDTIKEGNLRIREMTKATAEALDAIGISSEKVQEDLRNGSITTFDVMQAVATKLAEMPASSAAVGTAIADIFGGPGEDAGLEYIKTLATAQLSMDALKTAAGNVAIEQERQIQNNEDLSNSLSGLIDLSALYTNVQPYVELTAQVGMAAAGFGSFIKLIKEMNIQQAIAATRMAAVAVAQKVVTAATVAWTAVQKVLNIVLTANPIGLVIAAIGALVTAVVYAYNNCESFRNIVNKVWEAIKPLATAIMDGLAKAFEWLVEKCKEAWEWLKNILGLGNKKVEVSVEVTKKMKTEEPKMNLGDYTVTPGSTSTGKATTPKVTTVSTDTKSSEGLIGRLEEKISDARNRLREATSEAAIEAINKEIETYESELSKYEGLGKEVAEAVGKGVEDSGPLWKADASNLKDINDNIKILNEQLQTASITEAAMLNKQIDAWKAKADAIKNAGREAEKTVSIGKSMQDGWSGIKSIGSSIEGITDSLKGNGSAWQMVVGIVDGFISLYQGIQTVVGIIQLLTGASAAHATTKIVEGAAETTASGMRAGAAATDIATTTGVIAANKLEAASFQELAAAEYMAAHAYIPFAGFGIALGFTEAMVAAVQAAGVPMLAEGGVASGPTLAMVGEYAGASGNPEVIAPLDKLRGLLGDSTSSVDGKVRFEIEGRTLVGILKRENNLSRRS